MNTDSSKLNSDALFLCAKFLRESKTFPRAFAALVDEMQQQGCGLDTFYSWTGEPEEKSFERMDFNYPNLSDNALMHRLKGGSNSDDEKNHPPTLLQYPVRCSLIDLVALYTKFTPDISALKRSIYDNRMTLLDLERSKYALSQERLTSSASVTVEDTLHEVGVSKAIVKLSNSIDMTKFETKTLEADMKKVVEVFDQNGWLCDGMYKGTVDSTVDWLTARELGQVNSRRHGTGVYKNGTAVTATMQPTAQRCEQKIYCRYEKLFCVGAHCLNPAYCAVFDQTGVIAISGADDFLIKMWDVGCGRLLRTCRGHQGYIMFIAVSGDNSMFASICTQGLIRVWRMCDGCCIMAVKHHQGPTETDADGDSNPTGVNWLQFDKACNILVSSGEDGMCTVWDIPLMIKLQEDSESEQDLTSTTVDMTASGRIDLTALQMGADANTADTTPSPSNITSTLQKNGLFSWCAKSQYQLMFPHRRGHLSQQSIGVDQQAAELVAVNCSDICPLGHYVATGGDDGIARIWYFGDDFQKNSVLKTIQSLQPSSNKRELSQRRLVSQLEGHLFEISLVKFSNAGDRIVTGSLKEGVARVWVFQDYFASAESIALQSTEHNDVRSAIQKSVPSNRTRGSNNHTSQLYSVGWTCDDLKLVTLHSQKRHAECPWSARVPSRASADGSTVMRIWDSWSGELLSVVDVSVDRCDVCAMHPLNGALVSTGGADGHLTVWNIVSSTALVVHHMTCPEGTLDLEEHSPVRINDISFSPDGTRILITDFIGRVTVFGIDSLSRFTKVKGEQYFSTDYNDFVVDDYTYRAIDVGTQQPVDRVTGSYLCRMDGTPYIDDGGGVHQFVTASQFPSCVNPRVIPPRFRQQKGSHAAMNGIFHVSYALHQSARRNRRREKRHVGGRNGANSAHHDDPAEELVTAKKTKVVRSAASRQSYNMSELYGNRGVVIDVSSSDDEEPESRRKKRRRREHSHATFVSSVRSDRTSTRPQAQDVSISSTYFNTQGSSQRQRYNRTSSSRPTRRSTYSSTDSHSPQRRSSRRMVQIDSDDSNDSFDSVSSDSADGSIIDQLTDTDEDQRTSTGTRVATKKKSIVIEDEDEEDANEVHEGDIIYYNKSKTYTKSKKKSSVVSDAYYHYNRAWLMASTTCDNQYVPQVGDFVYYLPQGHLEMLRIFGEKGSTPWSKFPQQWPIVEAQVLSVDYKIPEGRGELKGSNGAICLSVIVFVTLRLTCVPSKWNAHPPSSQRRHHRHTSPATPIHNTSTNPNPNPAAEDRFKLLADFVSLRATRNGNSDNIFVVKMRSCGLPEFLIPRHLYQRCLHVRWSLGMKISVPYTVDVPDGEENEVAMQNYTGVVCSPPLSDANRDNWPNSPWEALSVKWDTVSSSGIPDSGNVGSPGYDDGEEGTYDRIGPWDATPILSTSSSRPPPGCIAPSITTDLTQYLLSRIELVYDIAEYGPFLYPVDKEVFPNYYEVIAVPIDVKLIENRLRNEFYRQVDGYFQDVDMIYTNCLCYNMSGSPIVEQSHALVTYLRDLQGGSSSGSTSTSSSTCTGGVSTIAEEVDGYGQPAHDQLPTSSSSSSRPRGSEEESGSNDAEEGDVQSTLSMQDHEEADQILPSSSYTRSTRGQSHSNPTTAIITTFGHSQSSRTSRGSVSSTMRSDLTEDEEGSDEESELSSSVALRPQRTARRSVIAAKVESDSTSTRRSARSDERLQKPRSNVSATTRHKRNRPNYLEQASEDDDDGESEEEVLPRHRATRRSGASSAQDVGNAGILRLSRRAHSTAKPSPMATAATTIPAVTAESLSQSGSSQSHRRLSPDVKKQMLLLMKYMEDIEAEYMEEWGYSVFTDPVTDDVAPGYSDIVTDPMSKSTIRKQFQKQHYQTIEDMIADYYLIFTNCQLYNESDSSITLEALRQLDLLNAWKEDNM